ncbi:protein-disulfide reductase DsbD [Halothiobacillus sp.]|uniref:protein-disulfide reductase DsbD n=1 Tax=Halothiobacillus sp. TaxID=1891311 RepID=UPI00261CAE26|nr:protein-disulfide reductase DsbD [Halothiobacillus sp.]
MSLYNILKATLTGLLLFSSVLFYSSAKSADLLDPQEAFHATAAVNGSDIELKFHVANGYHLYRDRIAITSQTDSLKLGKPVLPEGVVDDDPYFGKLVVYKQDFTVQVPIEASLAGEAKLKLKYQGCSDTQGVCYPPQTQDVTVSLPADSTKPSSAAPSSLSSLSSLGGSEEQLLDPEQAFKASIQLENSTILLHWDIADNYHLYRDRIKIGLADTDARITTGSIPNGKIVDDPGFGKTEVFYHNLDAKVGIEPGKSNTAIVVVGSQGCADAGLCYPPTEHAWKVNFKTGAVETLASAPKTSLVNVASLTGSMNSAATEAQQPAQLEPVQRSQTDAITHELQTGSLWTIILGFLVIGLLLAFTPCVFPMIPILAGIIAGQGENITTRKAFILSVVYVLAMAVTYTIAGILAGLFGSNLQAAFQNPWILTAFAGIFVALAFSMFGFFELQLPSSLQSKIMQVQNNQQGGTLIGVAIMGLLSALIVGPCMAPPLAGALIYIGQTGDAVLGGTALFAMSIGMGLPLIIVGTLGGKFLPRAGAWMDAVKNVFGVLMLGVAIWMLERIVPDIVAQALWGILLIGAAVYLSATDPLREAASGWSRLWKTLGVILLIWGVLILVGVATGGKGSVFSPLAGLSMGTQGNGAQTTAMRSFTRVKNLDDLNSKLAQAKAEGKPVMLDFYADWCVSCKEMEHNTFSDPSVIAALRPFVLLQADVTANNADDKTLFKRFGILGPPTIVFFNAQGVEQKAQQVVGYEPPKTFIKHIEATVAQ